MKTNTVIIYDTLFENPIRYFVVDKDVSYLHGMYVNSTQTAREYADEICDIVYDEGGNWKPFLEDFPC